MARPRKYEKGQEPTGTERAAGYLDRLREAGGRRASYNWKPAVVDALDLLKSDPKYSVLDETTLIGTLIIDAAENLPTTKKTRSKA